MRPTLSSTLLACLALSLSGSPRSQSVVYTLDGSAAGERFGCAVAAAGDVNADGWDDVVVGAWGAAPSGTLSGRVRVISGRTGLVLRTHDGAATEDFFGAAVAGAGDVNGDGYADIVVGAHRADGSGVDSGRAYVFSGVNGSTLFTFSGDSAGDLFGWSVDGAGDVNGDGFDDVIVGAIFDDNTTTDAGSAKVFSGRDGSVLYTLNGSRFEGYYGWSVAGLGDVNQDGYEEFIVGSPADDTNGLFAGIVRVYSGRTGNVLYTLLGSNVLDQFGHAVSNAGDVNKDGYPDIAVGIPGDDTNGVNAGAARVYSGFTGLLLYSFLGDGTFDVFGYSVSGAGDLDGDGYDDVLVGAPGDDNTGINAGSARAFSGQTGATLFTFHGGAGGNQLGTSVASAGDVDADGYDEVVLGADRAAPTGADSGRALVVDHGQVGTPARGRAIGRPCPSSGGSLPRVRHVGHAQLGLGFTVHLRGARPNALAVMNLGISFNLDLTPAGAPGCIAYAYPLVGLNAPTSALGFASASVSVPNNPSFVGVRLHNSYLIVDPGANRLGLVTSDDLVVTIGT